MVQNLKRIERITYKIGLLWVKFPDQRLFQLLSNHTRLGLRGSKLGNIRDPFHYKDNDIESDLDKAIKKVYGK